MAAPRVTYIIASTMRTGSYLLCGALQETGVAGHPREVFCPERRANYAGEWKLPPDISLDDYGLRGDAEWHDGKRRVRDEDSRHHVEPLARGGRLGRRAMAGVAVDFSNSALHSSDAAQPACAGDLVVSRDRDEPVVEDSGVDDWEVTGVEPKFDGLEIRGMELELERQDLAWEKFFAAGPCELLMMDYETLASDYRNEVGRALKFIGEDPALAQQLPEPRLIRQADELSREWEQRMDAEFPLL